MKKATTTLAELQAALDRIARDLRLDEAIRARMPNASDDDRSMAGLFLGEPVPAESVGRGERVRVAVITMWNEPPLGTIDAPLATLCTALREIPGVEEVSVPNVDTQLGSVWGVDVTIRLSQ